MRPCSFSPKEQLKVLIRFKKRIDYWEVVEEVIPEAMSLQMQVGQTLPFASLCFLTRMKSATQSCFLCHDSLTLQKTRAKEDFFLPCVTSVRFVDYNNARVANVVLAN